MPREQCIVWNSACAYLCAIFFHGWGTRGKVFFGIEHRSQGEGEAVTPKQQPQRVSTLGTGAGASLASPLSRLKACSQSYYTGNSYAAIAIGLHQA